MVSCRFPALLANTGTLPGSLCGRVTCTNGLAINPKEPAFFASTSRRFSIKSSEIFFMFSCSGQFDNFTSVWGNLENPLVFLETVLLPICNDTPIGGFLGVYLLSLIKVRFYCLGTLIHLKGNVLYLLALCT
ncbi:MAG: hypothetical protein BWX92_03604 [Deltaproteobacteria bacterium ADurb.Bin135]|nr:MAG: hypothetical protein BWX92_03604 [Deltaproteobacteria bacterium ADurb.Bin135]